MRKRKQEWREAEVQGESGERGREGEGEERGGEGEGRQKGRGCMPGMKREGVHVKWGKMHSEQESCREQRERANVWRENFRVVSALSATFTTNSTFEHFNSGICA